MGSRLVDFGRLNRMRDRKLDSEEFAVKMISRLGGTDNYSWSDANGMTFGYGGFLFATSWGFSHSVCFGRVWRADSFTPGRISG